MIVQRVINSCDLFSRNFSTNGIFKNVVGEAIYITSKYSVCPIEMSYSTSEIKSGQKAVGNDG